MNKIIWPIILGVLRQYMTELLNCNGDIILDFGGPLFLFLIIIAYFSNLKRQA